MLWQQRFFDLADHMLCVVKHVVDQTVSRAPLAQNIALVKHAGVHGAVPCLDLFGQAEVILHGEVEVQDILQFNVFILKLFLLFLGKVSGTPINPV